MRTAAPVPFVAGLVRSLRTLIHGLLFDAGFMHQPTPKDVGHSPPAAAGRGGGGDKGLKLLSGVRLVRRLCQLTKVCAKKRPFFKYPVALCVLPRQCPSLPSFPCIVTLLLRTPSIHSPKVV